MSDDPFVELHAVFEQRNDDEAAYQQALDRHRRAAHAAQGGTDDTYQPLREFPCPGSLREVDRTRSHITIRCDTCRYETTRRQPDIRPLERDPEEAVF